MKNSELIELFSFCDNSGKSRGVTSHEMSWNNKRKEGGPRMENVSELQGFNLTRNV